MNIIHWFKGLLKPEKIKNKKVIYTIIFGEYDYLKEPEFISPDFDYICFTDIPDLKSEIWKIKLIKLKNKTNLKRCAAALITNPFKYLAKYDLSVLVGGQISIHCDISEFIRTVLPLYKSIAIMHHPVRDCIYEEAEAVLELKKEFQCVVNKQMDKYRRLRYPEHNGLVSSGIVVRRHNDKKLKKHCKLWHQEIKKHSQRDQLSFNFVLWKYKLIDPAYFSRNFRTKDFIVHLHNFVQRF
ncbi:MAG: glycosyltransferase domain-containing protein [Bacteroidota bacterium]